MLSRLINFLKSCWRSSSNSHVRKGFDSTCRQDGLLWYKDIGQHLLGDFSMAVVQANNLLEDQSQIESGSLSLLDSGPCGTFVGVYDGHGGPETSRFINDHLFQHLKRFTTEQKSMSVDVIRKAFQATEEGFLSLVAKQWPINPQIAAVGSCCLVGIICHRTLYIANLGDSRAVLGRLVKATGEVLGIQLSTEHNANIESIRQELQAMHPDDPQIVFLKRNVWRVKGLIQISRSIGDVYLKKAEYNREPLYAKFRLKEPFNSPILSSEPSILVHEIEQHDQFLIFASDGLWEHLSNQEAVDIVQSGPPNGSARRLVKAALQEAAKKREMRYSDLKKIDRGVRRHFHDDMTIIVVFLDSNLGSENQMTVVIVGEFWLQPNQLRLITQASWKIGTESISEEIADTTLQIPSAQRTRPVPHQPLINARRHPIPDSSDCHKIKDDSKTSSEKTAPEIAPTAAPLINPLSVSWPIKAPVNAPNKVPTARTKSKTHFSAS
nr:probable protein phosphatase 2C 60 isoform X2 [Ipomoea trifida]